MEEKYIKRYWVFAYYDYYPSGGMGDFRQSFDDLDEAKYFCDHIPDVDKAQVYDALEECYIQLR